MKSLLVECGWGATRKKDGYLKRKYKSLIARRGKKKALVAVGHKIIIAAYHVSGKNNAGIVFNNYIVCNIVKPAI